MCCEHLILTDCEHFVYLLWAFLTILSERFWSYFISISDRIPWTLLVTFCEHFWLIPWAFLNILSEPIWLIVCVSVHIQQSVLAHSLGFCSYSLLCPTVAMDNIVDGTYSGPQEMPLSCWLSSWAMSTHVFISLVIVNSSSIVYASVSSAHGAFGVNGIPCPDTRLHSSELPLLPGSRHTWYLLNVSEWLRSARYLWTVDLVPIITFLRWFFANKKLIITFTALRPVLTGATSQQCLWVYCASLVLSAAYSKLSGTHPQLNVDCSLPQNMTCGNNKCQFLNM